MPKFYAVLILAVATCGVPAFAGNKFVSHPAPGSSATSKAKPQAKKPVAKKAAAPKPYVPMSAKQGKHIGNYKPPTTFKPSFK